MREAKRRSFDDDDRIVAAIHKLRIDEGTRSDEGKFRLVVQIGTLRGRMLP